MKILFFFWAREKNLQQDLRGDQLPEYVGFLPTKNTRDRDIDSPKTAVGITLG